MKHALSSDRLTLWPGGLVQRWFVRQRSFASGIAVSGIGVGTLVMPKIAEWLIDGYGWPSARRHSPTPFVAGHLSGKYEPGPQFAFLAVLRMASG